MSSDDLIIEECGEVRKCVFTGLQVCRRDLDFDVILEYAVLSDRLCEKIEKLSELAISADTKLYCVKTIDVLNLLKKDLLFLFKTKEEKYLIADECLSVRNFMINGLKVCRDDINQVDDYKDKCENFMVKVKILGESIAQSGGQKQSCQETLNLLQSLKADLHRLFVKRGGCLNDKSVEWQDTESALQNVIPTGIIKNLKHLEPKIFFLDAGLLLKDKIRKILSTQKVNLKVYGILTATSLKKMIRLLKSKNTSIPNHFRFFPRPI